MKMGDRPGSSLTGSQPRYQEVERASSQSVGEPFQRIANIRDKFHTGSGNLTDEIRTLVKKRISYLLQHGAKSEDVAISPQGHISMEEVTNWWTEDSDIEVDVQDIRRLVASDLKGRFSILGDTIGAVNGHSMELPKLSIPDYNEKLGCKKRYLVHETYLKCLPAIVAIGLSRIDQDNIHHSMTTGRARLQRKRKPNIGIYIDVTKAKTYGLKFLHCSYDVIMC